MRMRLKFGLAEPACVCALRPQHARTPLAALFPVAMMTVLSGCAGSTGSTSVADTFDSKWGVSSSQRILVSGPIPKGGGHAKLGRPYQIGGRWYVPRHEPYYDRQGVGSWYGKEFHGRKTANGELYDMDALTAAHPTLPLPSYAYVTNMRNGRTILVRINDRGPYVANREIDLSRASARAIGYMDGGLGRVRVRWAGHAPLNGDDSREQAFLRNQPWNGGKQPPPAVARFDRPAAPLPDRRYPPPQARYAQDMNRKSDAEYDRPYGRYDQRRDDPAQYNDARYDQAPAAQGSETGYPSERWQPAYNEQPRQDRPLRSYEDTAPSQPQRAVRAYDPGEPPVPEAPVEPRRPADPGQQQWSPFDHREQVKTSSRR
jgi:rare lipoprotein A (peptidoglycan hydrolase)